MLSSPAELRGHQVTGAPAAVETWPVDDTRWLDFIETRPDATLFHHPSWSRLLAETYGYRTRVLVQTGADGQVVAGLPVVELRGPLGNRRFSGLPLTDHCPPLVDSRAGLDSFTKNLTRWHAAASGRRLAVHGELAIAAGVHRIPQGFRHVLPLGRPSGEIFESLKGTPVQRAIKKAQRQGIQIRISRSPEDLDAFYRLHVETRRRLGVPVQPRRFMELLWNGVLRAGLGFAVIGYHDGHPVAAGLFLAWNRNLVFKFGASDVRYWELRPNNLVMWSAIDWACQHGYQLLDFGRTDFDNQGLRDFKRRWGSTELSLVYSYVGRAPSSRKGATLPRQLLTRLIRSSPPRLCRLIGEGFYRHVVPIVS